MLAGRVPRETDFHVIRYRFARSLEDLGRPTLRKLVLATAYLVRQVLECLFRRPDVGFLTATTQGGGLLRDALYMAVFRAFRIPSILYVPAMGLTEEVLGATGVRGRILRATIPHAAALVALNRVHAAELERLAPGRVTVIRNALPDLPDTTGGGAGKEAGAGAGTGARVNRVLFLSNLLPEKGAGVLLEALPRVLGRVDVTVTFAGGWPESVSRDAFMARAGELGVADRVTTAGRVAEVAKLRLLDQANLFVFPSWHPTECSPNVVIEAMRHGLPMVATRVGGVPELVEDERSALLVPPNDAAALADAMVRVLTDRALAGRLGAAARAEYEARHRQERWEREVLGVIGRVV